MSGAMVQFRHRGPAAPTLAEVCERFGLNAEELDPVFGVIATDPEAGLYAVLVAETSTERVAKALASEDPDPSAGVFANPQIEPFGPA